MMEVKVALIKIIIARAEKRTDTEISAVLNVLMSESLILQKENAKIDIKITQLAARRPKCSKPLGKKKIERKKDVVKKRTAIQKSGGKI